MDKTLDRLLKNFKRSAMELIEYLYADDFKKSTATSSFLNLDKIISFDPIEPVEVSLNKIIRLEKL